MADSETNLANRDGFQSKWGFILACIGSAVGMGNIWRFPIMVSTYGGLTFLIPYCIFVVLIGATGVIGEFALGRAAGAGPIGARLVSVRKFAPGIKSPVRSSDGFLSLAQWVWPSATLWF